jgi:hypothetical protein
MWDDIVKYLDEFPDAVLNVVGDTGYPFSVRCTPEPDLSNQVLRIKLPSYSSIQFGPASLLCHGHDELMWNLKSFMITCSLERDDKGWKLVPRRFIPGIGIGNFFLGLIKMIRDGRKTTKRYLDKRGIPRPKIPWNEIQDLYK